MHCLGDPPTCLTTASRPGNHPLVGPGCSLLTVKLEGDICAALRAYCYDQEREEEEIVILPWRKCRNTSIEGLPHCANQGTFRAAPGGRVIDALTFSTHLIQPRQALARLPANPSKSGSSLPKASMYIEF